MDLQTQEAVHIPAGEGDAVWALGDLYTFKIDSDATDGKFALWETWAPAGHAGAPPHLHRQEDETFMILEGRLEIYREGETLEAAPGSVVHVPRGTMHFFRNTSDAPARFLVMVAPGGFEGFFREIGEAATDRRTPPAPAGPPDVERLTEVARRYGCDILPPPKPD